MNHDKRVQIAERLTKLMVNKYGKDNLLGGIFGSTAKGTDTEYSDLEMLFVVRNKSKAKSFNFAYEAMPVTVMVQKVKEVEKNITEIDLHWPLKMGRLFNLKITQGNGTVLKRFRQLLENLPKERRDSFIAKEAPLCYEEVGRLKAVKIKGNIHEAGLFVFEILFEFTLLIAIFNREFINYDYLGGVSEAFEFRKLPKDYKTTAEKLLNWTSLSLDEVVRLAERFVSNFAEFMAENGIKLEENTPLEKLDI